jgi:hypothetical protein
VIENPHQYFDTSLYKLPYALNAPEVLKYKPLYVFALHNFFLSTSPPFQFRSNDPITKCRTSGGEDELDFGLLQVVSIPSVRARNIRKTLDH